MLDSASENPWQDGNDADLHWECSDKTLGNFFFFYHESGQTLEQLSSRVVDAPGLAAFRRHLD